MSHKKYLREQRAKHDRDQATLEPKSKTGIKVKFYKLDMEGEDANQRYMCPFCLHQDKLRYFLIQTGKGIHRGLAECPECKNKCKLSTLKADMTPEQYADFAYGYKGFGFWQKVPFETWKERLYKIGWAHRFWERYKQLKGEDEEE